MMNKGKPTAEIFVCDLCNKFEGTFSVVAAHEKVCGKQTKEAKTR